MFNREEYDEKLKNMKLGEKLPCGCEVIYPAWTRDEAREKVYTALSQILSKNLEEVKKNSEKVVIRSLGLDTRSLRLLWGKFFVACDLDFKNTEEGGAEYLVDDSKLPMIPSTIEKLIDEVATLHRFPGFKECMGHAF